MPEKNRNVLIVIVILLMYELFIAIHTTFNVVGRIGLLGYSLEYTLIY